LGARELAIGSMSHLNGGTSSAEEPVDFIDLHFVPTVCEVVLP
jgi:hypothetical protein